MKLVLVAAAALLDAGGRVLLARRPEGKPMAGLWEFPGGKIEPDETPEQALVRELKEELGIRVARESLEPVTFASHAYPDFHLLMALFRCTVWDGTPEPREGQAVKWVEPHALALHPAPAADIPLFRVIAGSKGAQG